jgi:putative flippase GtrA
MANTLLGYVLFLLLIKLFAYLYAYSISYCIGIVFGYIFNTKFVFRKELSWHRFLQFPIVYVIQYALGALILWMLIGQANVAPAVAMILVVAVTVPVTFLASRFVIKRNTDPRL